MISIIIPIYNSEKYLEACLESVIKQTYTDFEVICVNDGSTDASEYIISEFKEKDSRVKYYKKNHTNAGEARNIGLKYASGDYFYFMDSDDILLPTILEELILITKKQNPDMVIFQYKLLDDNTQTISDRAYGIELEHCQCPSSNVSEISKLDVTNIAVWNKLYSADFLKKYDIQFKSHASLNDVYFSWLALMVADRIILHKKVGIYYRINSGNSISDNLYQTLQTIIDAFVEVNEFAIKNDLWVKYRYSLLKQQVSQFSEFKDRLSKCNQLELLNIFIQKEIDFFNIYNEK